MKTKKERAHKYSKRKYTKTIPENKIPYNAQIKNNRTCKNVTLQHTNTMQLTQHKINPKQPNNLESTPMKFRLFEKTIFCLLFIFVSFLSFLDQIKRERCFEIAIAPKSRQFFFQRKFEVEKRDYTKEFGREIPGLVDKNLKLLILSNQMFVQ